MECNAFLTGGCHFSPSIKIGQNTSHFVKLYYGIFRFLGRKCQYNFSGIVDTQQIRTSAMKRINLEKSLPPIFFEKSRSHPGYPMNFDPSLKEKSSSPIFPLEKNVFAPAPFFVNCTSYHMPLNTPETLILNSEIAFFLKNENFKIFLSFCLRPSYFFSKKVGVPALLLVVPHKFWRPNRKNLPEKILRHFVLEKSLRHPCFVWKNS